MLCEATTPWTVLSGLSLWLYRTVPRCARHHEFCLKSPHQGAPIKVMCPSDYFLPYEDLELKTSDGVTLRCYLIRETSEPTSAEAGGADNVPVVCATD